MQPMLLEIMCVWVQHTNTGVCPHHPSSLDVFVCIFYVCCTILRYFYSLFSSRCVFRIVTNTPARSGWILWRISVLLGGLTGETLVFLESRKVVFTNIVLFLLFKSSLQRIESKSQSAFSPQLAPFNPFCMFAPSSWSVMRSHAIPLCRVEMKLFGRHSEDFSP